MNEKLQQITNLLFCIYFQNLMLWPLNIKCLWFFADIFAYLDAKSCGFDTKMTTFSYKT